MLLYSTSKATAKEFTSYTRTGGVAGWYPRLNSVQSVETSSPRQAKQNTLDRRRTCQNLISVKKIPFVDAKGYVRIATERTPFTSCQDEQLTSETTYPQLEFVSTSGNGWLVWSNGVKLMYTMETACNLNKNLLNKMTYQGLDLINGKVDGQLSQAELYSGNYKRETVIAKLMINSSGTYKLSSGEDAAAKEYVLGVWRYTTQQAKQAQGWGNTPLLKWLGGNKSNQASSGESYQNSPGYNPNSREYASWFSSRPPQQIACKFLLVDLSTAPKYQQNQSKTTEPSWR